MSEAEFFRHAENEMKSYARDPAIEKFFDLYQSYINQRENGDDSISQVDLLDQLDYFFDDQDLIGERAQVTGRVRPNANNYDTDAWDEFCNSLNATRQVDEHGEYIDVDCVNIILGRMDQDILLDNKDYVENVFGLTIFDTRLIDQLDDVVESERLISEGLTPDLVMLPDEIKDIQLAFSSNLAVRREVEELSQEIFGDGINRISQAQSTQEKLDILKDININPGKIMHRADRPNQVASALNSYFEKHCNIDHSSYKMRLTTEPGKFDDDRTSIEMVARITDIELSLNEDGSISPFIEITADTKDENRGDVSALVSPDAIKIIESLGVDDRVVSMLGRVASAGPGGGLVFNNIPRSSTDNYDDTKLLNITADEIFLERERDEAFAQARIAYDQLVTMSQVNYNSREEAIAAAKELARVMHELGSLSDDCPEIRKVNIEGCTAVHSKVGFTRMSLKGEDNARDLNAICIDSNYSHQFDVVRGELIDMDINIQSDTMAPERWSIAPIMRIDTGCYMQNCKVGGALIDVNVNTIVTNVVNSKITLKYDSDKETNRQIEYHINSLPPTSRKNINAFYRQIKEWEDDTENEMPTMWMSRGVIDGVANCDSREEVSEILTMLLRDRLVDPGDLHRHEAEPIIMKTVSVENNRLIVRGYGLNDGEVSSLPLDELGGWYIGRSAP